MGDTGTGKLVTRQTSGTVRPRNFKEFEETCPDMTYKLKPALLTSPFVFRRPNTAPWWPQSTPTQTFTVHLLLFHLRQDTEHQRYVGVSARFLKAPLLCHTEQRGGKSICSSVCSREALFLQGCLADSLSFQKQFFWKRLSPITPQVPDATF